MSSTVTKRAQRVHPRTAPTNERLSQPKSSVRINKNLLNAPLARDVRAATDWWWSENANRWLCDVRGNANIQLRLPRKADRSPVTAFEMAVLFLVLSEAHEQRHSDVRFKSRTAMLSAIGYTVDTRNMRRLDAALELWRVLVIRHKRWYFPNMREPRRASYYDNRKLPPVFDHYDLDRSEGINVVLSKEWYGLAKGGFFGDVYLPLPKGAAAQNLVLIILAQSYVRGGLEDLRRRVRPLCRKLGLHNKDSAEKLRSAIQEADHWFLDRLGWYLVLDWPPGAHVLTIKIITTRDLRKAASWAGDENLKQAQGVYHEEHD